MKKLAVALALAAAAWAQSPKAAAKDPGPPLPEGEGREATARMCTTCHGTAVFAKLRMGRVGWEDQVQAMIEKGATGTEAEIETVVSYLVKHFGREARAKAAPPAAKVNVNQAAAKELETALGLTPEQAAAIVAYREKNGTFREWGDLAKVPGVEVQKLEEKRERVEF